MKSYLEHILGKCNVKMDVPMSTRTTFRIGGNAKFFVTPKTRETMLRLASALDYIEYPFRVIGAGSNVLFGDGGFDGVIIRPAFCEIVENGNFIYADAGASIGAVVKKATELGLSGLEFACKIPATVGGAVATNAHGHGACIRDVVTLVDVLRGGEIISIDMGKIAKTDIILGAYFYLRTGNTRDITALIDEYTARRLATQPTGASAGCTFRNPTPRDLVGAVAGGYIAPAGALIDQIGLKGTRIGGAEISQKHANFILNTGGATARDVVRLINLIKKSVLEKHGIKLTCEIERITNPRKK